MIETERLRLRRWEAGDLAPFAAMGRDPEVMAYIGPLIDAEAAAALIARLDAQIAAEGSGFMAVARRSDGAFLGFCGIKRGPEGTPISGAPEIGWRLAREHWGRGYAREAAAAALDHAWRTTDAPRVFAITVHGNLRSRGLMERLGMRRMAESDFDHPAVPPDSPLSAHVTYAIGRP